MLFDPVGCDGTLFCFLLPSLELRNANKAAFWFFHGPSHSVPQVSGFKNQEAPLIIMQI